MWYWPEFIYTKLATRTKKKKEEEKNPHKSSQFFASTLSRTDFFSK